jgi:hypothetical protein
MISRYVTKKLSRQSKTTASEVDAHEQTDTLNVWQYGRDMKSGQATPNKVSGWESEALGRKI